MISSMLVLLWPSHACLTANASRKIPCRTLERTSLSLFSSFPGKLSILGSKTGTRPLALWGFR